MTNAQSNFYRYDTDGNRIGLTWAGCEATRVAKLSVIRLPGSERPIAADATGAEVDLAALPKRAPTKGQVETLRRLLSGAEVNVENSNSLNSLLAKDLIRPVRRSSVGGRFSNIEFEVTAHGCVAFNKAEGR